MFDSILKKDASSNVEQLKYTLKKQNNKITQNDIYRIISEKTSDLQQQIDVLLNIVELLTEGYSNIKEPIEQNIIKEWINNKVNSSIKKQLKTKKKKIIAKPITETDVLKIIEKVIEKKLSQTEIKTLEANYTGKIYSRENETITDDWRFKESKGQGIIDQILLKTNTDQFRIYFIIDNHVNYENSYTFFANNSQTFKGISAYLDSGYYYLSIQNLSFQDQFSLRIIPLVSTITFNIIHVKYRIRDEVIIKEA